MNFVSQDTQEIEVPNIDVFDETTLSAKVILFNDEVHTFDDVILQLMKAISCSADEGEAYAWEVHTRGKACVFIGELKACLKVSSVLEEIKLHTQIEY